MELSVEGMEVPVEGVDAPVEGVEVPANDGVIVAARSRGANRPLTRGWSFHEMLGARLVLSIGDK